MTSRSALRGPLEGVVCQLWPPARSAARSVGGRDGDRSDCSLPPRRLSSSSPLVTSGSVSPSPRGGSCKHKRTVVASHRVDPARTRRGPSGRVVRIAGSGRLAARLILAQSSRDAVHGDAGCARTRYETSPFLVPPPEGPWWVEDGRPALEVPREEWRWQLLVRLPDEVDSGWVDVAGEQACAGSRAVER
jgi:hypothetical protein